MTTKLQPREMWGMTRITNVIAEQVAGWPGDRAPVSIVLECCRRLDGRKLCRPKFEVGQRVNYKAFTDHKGEYHAGEAGLVVQSMQIVINLYAPHVRLLAMRGDGWERWNRVEACQDAFEAA